MQCSIFEAEDVFEGDFVGEINQAMRFERQGHFSCQSGFSWGPISSGSLTPKNLWKFVSGNKAISILSLGHNILFPLKVFGCYHQPVTGAGETYCILVGCGWRGRASRPVITGLVLQWELSSSSHVHMSKCPWARGWTSNRSWRSEQEEACCHLCVNGWRLSTL